MQVEVERSTDTSVHHIANERRYLSDISVTECMY